MRCLKLLGWLLSFIGYSSCTKNSLVFYRDDYVFLDEGFYKYHEFKLNWHQAKEMCEFEGASLFYPHNIKEITRLNWVKNSFSDLHIGAIDANGSGTFVTVDNQTYSLPLNISKEIEKPPIVKDYYYYNTGKPICILYKNEEMSTSASDCDTQANFVCQKSQSSVQWNQECDMAVISTSGYDYEYNSELGKCYKLHTVPKTWQEAVKVCTAEQSSLTELNSQEEANHLVEMVSRVPEEEVGVVCLAFKLKYDGWKTLSGDWLQDSGYAMWAHTQPDGGRYEKFGAMAYNGRLHDIAGDARCIFVCEHKIGLWT